MNYNNQPLVLELPDSGQGCPGPVISKIANNRTRPRTPSISNYNKQKYLVNNRKQQPESIRNQKEQQTVFVPNNWIPIISESISGISTTATSVDKKQKDEIQGIIQKINHTIFQNRQYQQYRSSQKNNNQISLINNNIKSLNPYSQSRPTIEELFPYLAMRNQYSIKNQNQLLTNKIQNRNYASNIFQQQGKIVSSNSVSNPFFCDQQVNQIACSINSITQHDQTQIKHQHQQDIQRIKLKLGQNNQVNLQTLSEEKTPKFASKMSCADTKEENNSQIFRRKSQLQFQYKAPSKKGTLQRQQKQQNQQLDVTQSPQQYRGRQVSINPSCQASQKNNSLAHSNFSLLNDQIVYDQNQSTRQKECTGINIGSSKGSGNSQGMGFKQSLQQHNLANHRQQFQFKNVITLPNNNINDNQKYYQMQQIEVQQEYHNIIPMNQANLNNDKRRCSKTIDVFDHVVLDKDGNQQQDYLQQEQKIVNTCSDEQQQYIKKRNSIIQINTGQQISSNYFLGSPQYNARGGKNNQKIVPNLSLSINNQLQTQMGINDYQQFITNRTDTNQAPNLQASAQMRNKIDVSPRITTEKFNQLRLYFDQKYIKKRQTHEQEQENSDLWSQAMAKKMERKSSQVQCHNVPNTHNYQLSEKKLFEMYQIGHDSYGEGNLAPWDNNEIYDDKEDF